MPRQRTQTPVNGTAIRVIRERTGLTVADVVGGLAANGLDVHADHLRNIELGHKQPSPKLLAALASVLHVPQTALMATSPDSLSAQAGAATFAAVGSVLIFLELVLLVGLLGIGAR